jgi:hypothetical protein
MPKTSSEEVLVDKIYTFLAPSDSWQCDNQILQANYNYMLLVEIVTPHDCQINVTIIDPVLDVYKVFRTDVNISQDDGWFNFPFGTAIGGNYTFIFSVIAELNLNLLIKISFDPEHDKCLYDIMSSHDIANLNLYRVTKFHDQEAIEHQIFLRTDYCHKFYIGRVSSIGGDLPSVREVGADYDINDPEGIQFKIYDNKTLENVGAVVHFNFATAIEGIYTIKIVIHCNVEVVNIAYAVVEDYKKSTENECNSTGPDPVDPVPGPNNGTNNGTTPLNYYYVPIEWTFGFVVSAGLVVGALIVIGSARRKRKSVGLN